MKLVIMNIKSLKTLQKYYLWFYAEKVSIQYSYVSLLALREIIKLSAIWSQKRRKVTLIYSVKKKRKEKDTLWSQFL